MKLALIIDDYLPHSTRVGAKMFHELAVELQSKGHQVVVITPQPNQDQRLVKDAVEGVEVWRFNSGKIKDISKVKRAINETFLSYMAWIAIRKEIKPNSFDGIIYYSPSIFFGGLVSKLKKYCHCPAYLILRDFFPQWAIDGGMIRKGSLIERYFRFFEKYSYNQADSIGVMSENNLKLFKEVTSDHYSTHILRNWASLASVASYHQECSFRQKLGIENKILFFYGGNIGHAQDMANLMRLTKKMQKYPKAHFLFVGQGDEVNLINRLAKEWLLENFSYMPSIDQDAFKQLLQEIDVGLFSLAASHTAHNFPGKLLGYMQEGKPILGSVNVGNDLLETINENKAGFCLVNGEDELLFQAAEKLMSTDLRTDLGLCSKELLKSQFTVEASCSVILSELQ
ncbi:glycosyltransferase WbuB [Endozoicomonas sp. (ex Bugula neritina AB1)]|nr:glycosyltransferase WbuB [Endozoicomonas sp. (ex Bugula neritina AB1)]